MASGVTCEGQLISPQRGGHNVPLSSQVGGKAQVNYPSKMASWLGIKTSRVSPEGAIEAEDPTCHTAFPVPGRTS